MPQNLTGKVAIVTGGASGVGLGTVDVFLKEGARVVIADIDDDAGRRSAERLGDDCLYVHTDVSRENEVEALVAETVQQFGRLDVMFNNAGAAGDTAPLLEIENQGFLRTMELLVGSAVAGHKYAAKQFRAQDSGGSIITTASVASLQGGFSPLSYTIAKAGLLGLVRHAASELSKYRIRSNAILPGAIATPILARSMGMPSDQADAFTDFVSQRVADGQPLGRIGTPADVAGAAVYFASDMSEWVTGTSLVVDGGLTSVTMGQLMPNIGKAATEFKSTFA